MDIKEVSAYLSVFLPVIFLLGLVVVLSRNPWFSFTNNALSDMGSLKNPERWYFNGFLMVFAVVGFIAAFGAFKSGLSYLMPLAMASLFIVGVFPEELPYHTPSAVLFYVLALADIVIIGVKLGRSGAFVGYLWSIVSVLTFLSMRYLVRARAFRGLAIPEMVGAVTILGWFVYVGLLLMKDLPS